MAVETCDEQLVPKDDSFPQQPTSRKDLSFCVSALGKVRSFANQSIMFAVANYDTR